MHVTTCTNCKCLVCFCLEQSLALRAALEVKHRKEKEIALITTGDRDKIRGCLLTAQSTLEENQGLCGSAYIYANA